MQELISRCLKGELSPQYTVIKGMLFYKGKVYIAKAPELRTKLLRFLHDSTWGVHSGGDKPIQRVQRDFYWPGMKAESRAYIKSCAVCQQQKSDHMFPSGLLQAPYTL